MRLLDEEEHLRSEELLSRLKLEKVLTTARIEKGKQKLGLDNQVEEMMRCYL